MERGRGRGQRWKGERGRERVGDREVERVLKSREGEKRGGGRKGDREVEGGGEGVGGWRGAWQGGKASSEQR